MKSKVVSLIVAHRVDESLWTVGMILDRSERNCFVISLCRENDTDPVLWTCYI
ncbi:hypothetical protein [Rhodonellum sp.]|uniref:hypothetical protein n=1 Tax=Rhodonellum sp. TaxID=2231180 RepID=UPI002724C563|nr:hypothetical protein [Rhodonellum sp.]MDO9553403.1 hypothetical protein [Rhodonellum sp.]